MKYTTKWVIEQGKSDFLFFWGNDNRKPFSQWQPSAFTTGEYTFPTAEHWMMLQKALLFGDEESAKIIMSDPDPSEAKKQGRLVKGFDPIKWDEVKYDLVVEGNVLKFTQNPDMNKKLLDTEDKVLVEASPYDKIWGIGMASIDVDAKNPAKWRGENLLGYALMEVRDIMKILAKINL